MENYQLITKTKRGAISEIFAVLTFVFLSFAFRAYSGEFNSKLFIEQAENMHLKDSKVLEQYKSITDIRTEINSYIKHNSVFDKYLDEICENTVGNTMLKLLVANVKAKPTAEQKLINLVQVSGEAAQDQYVPSTHTVHINFDLYNERGINKHRLCGADMSKNLVSTTGTLSEFLFHELCHAFHDISGVLKPTSLDKSITLSHVYSSISTKHLWSNDEEAYNITGRSHDGVSLSFDPISCNMFDMWNSLKMEKSIVQRVFHCSWSQYQKIVKICSFDSLAKLEIAVKDHEAFERIIGMYKLHGLNPNFLLSVDKILIKTSEYILTKN